MKKDFQKVFGVVTVAAIFVSTLGIHKAHSMDGVHSNAEVAQLGNESQDVIGDIHGGISSGKAQLAVEDLKTLLGISARDPSDQESSQRLDKEDPNAGAAQFHVKLAAGDRHRLGQKLASIENERAALKDKLDKEAAAKRTEIHNQRKAIQTSRIGASNNSDMKLGQSLYENFIKESNINAQVEKSVSDFDAQHAVTLNFVQVNNEKYVNAIYMGDSKIWSGEPTSSLAQK